LALLLGLLRLLLGLFVLLFGLLLCLLHLLQGLLLLLLSLVVAVIGGQASPTTQIRWCLGELQVDRPAGRQRRAGGGVSEREHSDGRGPGENYLHRSQPPTPRGGCKGLVAVLVRGCHPLSLHP
jgi:hypothetical protein